MPRKPTSWHDALAVHPAAEMFPPLADDELLALGEDIITNGLHTAVAVWKAQEHSKPVLLDGRSRLDGLERAGCKVKVRFLDTGDGLEVRLSFRRNAADQWCLISTLELRGDHDNGNPYTYAISANIHRRHLTADQKRELIAKLIKAQPAKSNRQIAETAKASHHTVGAVRAELQSTGQVAQLEKTVGKDGKVRKQPAHKAPTAAAKPRPPARPDTKAQCATALQLIDAGYKSLARKFHPDTGGSNDAMAQLSQQRDRLRRYVEMTEPDTAAFHHLMQVSAAHIHELQNEKRLLQIKIKGLESEVEELKAQLAAAPAQPSAEAAADDGIPAFLRRGPVPASDGGAA
jgi:hypothetical protein